MGRTVRTLIALALVGGCGKDPPPAAEQPSLLAVLANELLGGAHEVGPADELLLAHARAIEEAVLAAGANTSNDVERIARRVTGEKLAPAIDTLHAHAHWTLARYPRAQRLDLEGWSGTGQAFAAGELGGATSVAKPPASEDERLDRLTFGWNAAGVAYSLDADLSRSGDLQPRRWALDHWAPADTVVLGDDLDSPTIVLDRATELAIVRLRWDPAGWYMPVGYDRYVRSSLAGADPSQRAPKGDLAAGQGPAYTLLVELHRAIQLAVATEEIGDDEKRVREIVYRVADERLVPRIGLMHEHTRHALHTWVPPADGTEWVDAGPPTSATDLVAIADEVLGPHATEHDRAARVFTACDPIQLANLLQWRLAERELTDDDRFFYWSLQRFARPRWVVVEDDLDAPALAFEGAHERTLVRMRWDPQGWYVPTAAQVQRRAGTTPSPRP